MVLEHRLFAGFKNFDVVVPVQEIKGTVALQISPAGLQLGYFLIDIRQRTFLPGRQTSRI